jgi:hypothetical protein
MIFGVATYGVRRRFFTSAPLKRVAWSHRWIQAFITFHLVLVAWVFFRASSITVAVDVLTQALSGLTRASLWGVITTDTFIISVLMVGFMEAVHIIERHGQMRRFLDDKPAAIRWAFYYVLILLIATFGMFHNPAQFIYFQF